MNQMSIEYQQNSANDDSPSSPEVCLLLPEETFSNQQHFGKSIYEMSTGNLNKSADDNEDGE